jgi:MOSC domain-containing protein YiiM
MRLLNFCIGEIQTIHIGGEPVTTAHVKAPVTEPWRITEEGPSGDRRAVHPDKVYAFARTGYEHWGRHLAIDHREWADGFFGENLTLDSLDETAVHLGDVFAIGDTVQLVVAGTRTPCAKLAWRLNQPRTFQAIFARSRNTGAYFDVLVPGQVRPGDDLRRIAHDPDMPSLAECQDLVTGTAIPRSIASAPRSSSRISVRQYASCYSLSSRRPNVRPQRPGGIGAAGDPSGSTGS